MPWRIASQHSVGMTEAEGEVRKKTGHLLRSVEGVTTCTPCSSLRVAGRGDLGWGPLWPLRSQDWCRGLPPVSFKAPFLQVYGCLRMLIFEG